MLNACTHIQDTKSLNLNLGFEPQSLDWNLANDSYSFDVISNLMVGLTKFEIDQDGAIISVPACAKSWSNDKNLAYKFKLDPRCTWTDGRPVKAQDFVDSFTRALNPTTAAPYADLLSLIDLSKTQALSESELLITLHHPAAYFIYLTSYGLTLPIRKDLIDKYNDKWTEPENIITNGAFKLKSWQHEYKIQLEANLDYQLAKSKIQNINFFMIPEQAIAFSLFKKKQLDIVDNRSIPNSELRKIDPSKIQKTLLLRNTYLGFNCQTGPMSNIKLRQALAHAIRREDITKILARAYQPNSSWIPPGLSPFYNAEIGLKYSSTRAKQLLKEALTELKTSKKELKIEFLFPSNEEAKLLSESLQSIWQEELGITVKLIGMEWKSYLATLENDPPDIFRLNWGADYPDPDTFMQLLKSNNHINYGGWKNTEYELLVTRAAALNNMQIRKKIYAKAEKLLLEEETAIVPLFINTQNVLMQDNIFNLRINPLDIIFLNKVRKTNG